MNFVKRGGCFSIIGPITGKSQIISLEDYCLQSYITPIHEIAHLLGVHHEHSRPDRDKYVKIYLSNTGKENKFNFKKFSPKVSSLYFEYDYNSFMHYNNSMFFTSEPFVKSTFRSLYWERRNHYRFHQRRVPEDYGEHSIP